MGEASLPGPKQKSPDLASLLSINVGGAPGAWRLLEENCSEALVICLQEINMKPDEWTAYLRMVNKMGYNGFYQPGPSSLDKWGNSRTIGGTAILIHRTLSHKFAWSQSHLGVQSVGVWIHGKLILNIYSPPGHDAVAAQLLGQWWATNKLDSVQWVVVGDFNADPEDSSAARFLTLQKGCLLGNPEIGSRWDSSKFIDWGMCSSPEVASFEGHHDHVSISDHKGFWVHVHQISCSSIRGRLKPAPAWIKPSWLDSCEWVELLEHSWTKIRTTPTHATWEKSMHRPSDSVDSVDVQIEWNLFIKNLNQCFIGAYENLMLQPGLSDDHIHELAQRLKKPGRRAKGAIATFQWFQDACSRRGHPNPGEKIRKLRRSLARLFEVRRLVRQNIRPPENLLQKLWPTTH